MIEFITENKDVVTLIISSIVGLVGVGTFIKAIIEYKLQGRQKRAELFDKYKTTLKSEKRLIQITQYLETDDIALKDIPILDRYFFLGFYEQIAIAVNSGLINKDVAHYMFSYFALRCWESKNFWYGINKKSYYWNEFRKYVDMMKRLENRNVNKTKLRKVFDCLTRRSEFKY
jgi:hypothetical protein